ncbi:Spermatogenesis-associated protein 6 [Apodemus speciosus]|uniref:Spermatogenesis-associated protein 6 n=1 Tax=Apodemus speciosus TaxID=105296 RepID=A0ABQ0EPE8_APOSI
MGIAPKLEFSTTSVITECLISSRKCRTQDKFTYHSAPVEKSHGRLQCRTSRSQKKKSKSPERSKYCINTKNYEQPTISSKSHSPSPYTKRRMCELSEDTRRRLAHLNLGPYEFKKETDKPPFVIRHVDPPSPRTENFFGSPGRDCERDGWVRMHSGLCHWGMNDLLVQVREILNLYILALRVVEGSELWQPHFPLFDEDTQDSRGHNTSCAQWSLDEGPWLGDSKGGHSRGSSSVQADTYSYQGIFVIILILAAADPRTTRFHSDWCSPPNCDEIHDRDERDPEKEDELELKRSLLYRDSAYDSDPEYSSFQRPRGSFHLDDGECWSNRAASCKGKSHRPVFENSMDKMYRNLYKKACSSVSHTQESF